MLRHLRSGAKRLHGDRRDFRCTHPCAEPLTHRPRRTRDVDKPDVHAEHVVRCAARQDPLHRQKHRVDTVARRHVTTGTVIHQVVGGAQFDTSCTEVGAGPSMRVASRTVPVAGRDYRRCQRVFTSVGTAAALPRSPAGGAWPSVAQSCACSLAISWVCPPVRPPTRRTRAARKRRVIMAGGAENGIGWR